METGLHNFGSRKSE